MEPRTMPKVNRLEREEHSRYRDLVAKAGWLLTRPKTNFKRKQPRKRGKS